MSRDRIQPPGSIVRPADVEPFDIQHEFKQSVEPALNYASAWLNDHSIPYIFITTLKVETKTDDEDQTVVSGIHNIRRNNLSTVRDFALCFAHEAMAAKNQVELGNRLAELVSNSPHFLEAFFSNLEKKGLLDQVLPGESEPQSPPDNEIH